MDQATVSTVLNHVHQGQGHPDLLALSWRHFEGHRGQNLRAGLGLLQQFTPANPGTTTSGQAFGTWSTSTAHATSTGSSRHWKRSGQTLPGPRKASSRVPAVPRPPSRTRNAGYSFENLLSKVQPTRRPVSSATAQHDRCARDDTTWTEG